MRIASSRLLIALVLPFLAACASLPGQGPSRVDIMLTEDATPEQIASRSYTTIDLTPAVVRVIGPGPRGTIGATLGNGGRGTRAVRLGVGDMLTVQIYESSPDGLFARSGNNQTAIPTVVNDGGEIFIPYVGNVPVLGLGIDDVRERITVGLEGIAVDPQVVVQMGTQGAQTVTVVGDARTSGRFDIPPSGLRLLDAVALAGGSREQDFDTVVRVVRDSRTAQARLDDVVRDTTNNIWLMPRDVVQLKVQPRSFTAFGAVASNRQQPFETETVTLAEALAQAGGLNGGLADKGGVFLFRFESEHRVKAAGGRLPPRVYAQGVPTIYRLDFSSPDAFFLAQSLEIRDKDILYVATAPAVEFRKFTDNILLPFLAVGDTAGNVVPALN